MKHRELKGGALAVTVLLSALWGGNSVAVKAGLDDCPPLRLGYLRFLLGGLVVLGSALVRKRSLRVRRDEWVALAGLGTLFASQIAFMNLGQDRTSAGHAAVLMSAYPLWTAVFAHFLVPGDRLTARRLAGALVAYGGVLVVFRAGLSGGDGVTLLGDALLFVSALLLGARQIVLSRFSQRITIEKLLMAQALVGGLSFLLTSWLFESGPTRYTVNLAAALLYQGVLIAGFVFLVQTWLLKNYPPSRVTTVYLSQPIFGVLLSWLVLGESVGPELLVGAPLVLLGSFVVQRRS